VRQMRLIVMIGCLGVVTLVSGALRAQSVPLVPRPGFRPMMQGGPPMFSFMGGETITGAPYSAQVTFEHRQTLPDGNRIDQKNSAMIYRDGQGRTRLEETRPTNSGNPQQIVRITDQVARVGYVLDPAKKTAHRFTLPPAKTETSQPNFRAGSNPNVISTSLGSNPNLEGFFVEGTQITRTIPAGQMGNTEAIQITTTRWYSPDLSADISTETTDPLRGNSTTTTMLTNISRDEPASTLFQVPSDYTVVNGGPGGRQRFAPSAPPQQ
jgi:hypothetical protein